MLIPSSNAHYPTLSDQVFVVQPNQFEFVTFQTCESVFVNAATIPLEFCLFDLVRFILHVNLHAVSTSKYYTLCREIALLPPTSTVLNSLGVDKVAASELMNFGLPSNSSNYVLIRSLCLSFVSYCSTDIYLLGAQSLSPKDLRRWDENWWNLVSKGDITMLRLVCCLIRCFGTRSESGVWRSVCLVWGRYVLAVSQWEYILLYLLIILHDIRFLVNI